MASKRCKRVLSVFLCVVMLLSAAPLSGLNVFAAEIVDSGICGENLTWTLDSDGLLRISGTGEMSNCSYSRAPWYNYRTTVVSIIIDSGVTSIGSFAFEYCKSLKSINVPDSVTSIGEWAFKYCSSLASITIPDSVTSIGGSAFYYCSSLASIIIPNSVTSIGNNAFDDCSGLARIDVASNNNNYSSLDGVLFSKDKKTLIRYPSRDKRTSYVIPNGVTTIDGCAFQSCSSLANIKIPNGVIAIGEYSFEYCSSLASITIPDSVTSIGRHAFYGTAYHESPSNWTDNVLYIGNCLIDANTSISGVYSIVAGTKHITDSAFQHCENLTGVTIPDSVATIGKNAFQYCHSLASITIPDGVKSIDTEAFFCCSSLVSITIPASATTIGEHALESCSSLASIEVAHNNNSYSSLDGILFSKDKTTLIRCPIGNKRTSYVIPDSVTTIGEWAFRECSNLVSITIPYSVTTISESAFAYCESLTNITIPDSVTTIGSLAFYNTAYYKNALNWIDNVLYIGNCLIESENSISGVYSIVAETKCIADDAFSTCRSLTSVTIPDSVTAIGEYAFYGCSSLASITILNSECNISDDEDTISDTATIYGYTGSTAEAYATKYNRDFVVLGTECQHVSYTSVAAKPATCTANGNTAETKCSVCNAIITASESILALGHDDGEWTVTKEATCTETGVKELNCTRCGELLDTQTIAKAAHTYSSWIITREATVAYTGARQRTCTICNYTETGVIEKLDGKTVEDTATGITVSYSNDTLADDIDIEVKQLFDGVSYQLLDRQYGKYELFDITLVNNGEKVQPNGKVWVKIPLPNGYNTEKTSVYYVTNTGSLQKMNGYCLDGYIYFEAEHFSEYALVDESTVENTPENCSCICHSKGLKQLIYKILCFLWRLFGTKQTCECGVNHY